MTDIKNKVQNLDPNVKARNIKDMVRPTGNMFEALVAISKRANQISNQLKRELHTKLEEFL